MQRLRRLATRRSERAAQRAFVIDGPVLVGEALDAGVTVEDIFVSATADGAARVAAERAEASGAMVWTVDPNVLARATDTVTPRGVAAVAGIPDASLDAALHDDLALVLVGVADPGNAGTLVRTAEAAGAGAVVFCGGAVDPFAPKVVRASAGSLFHVSVVSEGDPVQVLDRLGTGGRRRLGTRAHDGVDYDRADLTGPVALVLGSEAHGLPAEISPMIDEWVRVPMAGRAESLNVAMTGAVLCFDIARQRRARSVR
ncbi:MAG: TrmH family RNA methyltransferase [Acidimicrobiales bacterium]